MSPEIPQNILSPKKIKRACHHLCHFFSKDLGDPYSLLKLYAPCVCYATTIELIMIMAHVHIFLSKIIMIFSFLSFYEVGGARLLSAVKQQR